MRQFIRQLLVWILLIVSPMHAWAVVSTPVRLVQSVTPAAAMEPVQSMGSAGQGSMHPMQSQAIDAHPCPTNRHQGCNGRCTDCCIGYAMPSALALPVGIVLPESYDRTHYGVLSSVVATVPERPPRHYLS